jgi:hypothetical protein
MRRYINSFIDTLPDGDRVEANNLLHQASLEKKEIAKLLRKITQDTTIASVNFRKTGRRSIISGNELLQNFADLSMRMSLFYAITNSVTDLLDSTSVAMLSEIRDLEKELDYIEKSISNYAFRLSDGGSFNFAFMDSFSDYINVANDIDFNIPDRDGSYFTSEEQAFVDLQEDSLKINPINTFGVNIIARLAETNFVTENASMSDIENLTVSKKDTGWRITVNSAVPIAGTLDGLVGMHGTGFYTGAQAELEIVPIQPSPCDSVTLSPLSGSSVDVIQVRIFLDEDYNKSVDLLDSIKKISNQSTFYFEAQTVYKVLIYLRQSTYTRRSLEPSMTEEFYRDLFVKQRKQISYNSFRKKNKVRNLVSISQVFIKNFIREQRGLNKISIRNYNRRLSTGKWGPMDDSMGMNRVSINSRNRGDWFASDGLSRFTELLAGYKQVSEQLTRDRFPRRNESTRRPNPFYNFLNTEYVSDNTRSVKIAVGRLRSFEQPINKKSLFYRYEIGLNHVLIGMQSKPAKSVYVSRQLPSTGDIGELRLRESSQRSEYTADPTLDIRVATSVEYSVTTAARPALDSDWVAILPVNETEIIAERLFLDNTGKALLRFSAQSISSISVYANNRLVAPALYTLITGQNSSEVIAIDFDTTAISVSDIFTISYIPVINSDIVNFENLNFSNIPLISSFDEDGTGEGFTALSGQRTAALQNSPYINVDKVVSATYSPSSGLSYQPITVELQDGTNAINLTNYKGGSQTDLSSDNLGLSFIQNGKYLIFNKNIDQPFRVFYQYLPSNLRVRIVLRSNFADSNLTPKVDFYQVKAKIRQANLGLIK